MYIFIDVIDTQPSERKGRCYDTNRTLIRVFEQPQTSRQLDFLCMAKWLRRLLAKWKVPGSNLTMGKVSEKVSTKKKKKKKKKKGQLSSACMMEIRMTGVIPNS